MRTLKLPSGRTVEFTKGRITSGIAIDSLFDYLLTRVTSLDGKPPTPQSIRTLPRSDANFLYDALQHAHSEKVVMWRGFVKSVESA